MSTSLVIDKQAAHGITPACPAEGWGNINSNCGKHIAQSSQLLTSQEQRPEIQGNNILGNKKLAATSASDPNHTKIA